MILKEVLNLLDLLDRPNANGDVVAAYLRECGATEVDVIRLEDEQGATDHIKVYIAGTDGKRGGGTAPTTGIIGRLGGSGARPELIGHVSDGDGALAALAAAAKLARMHATGDRLPGDVIITTHICPDAPVKPFNPVYMMGSPIHSALMNKHEVSPEMDAILSIDTTRGNRVFNEKGVAITPPVIQGWILRVPEVMLDTLSWVSGRRPRVLPITMQDITPYGNEVYHINSIVQPAVATDAPVIGVALTAEVPVPGSATGATQPDDASTAGQFVIEVAKGFGGGTIDFYDEREFKHLVDLYGDMTRLQGP